MRGDNGRFPYYSVYNSTLFATGISDDDPTNLLVATLAGMIGYVIFGAIDGFLGGLTLLALKRAGFFAYLAEKR